MRRADFVLSTLLPVLAVGCGSDAELDAATAEDLTATRPADQTRRLEAIDSGPLGTLAFAPTDARPDRPRMRALIQPGVLDEPFDAAQPGTFVYEPFEVHVGPRTVPPVIRLLGFDRPGPWQIPVPAAPPPILPPPDATEDGDFVQWWRGDAEIIEQGYDIASAPQGDDPLILWLEVEAAKFAVMSDGVRVIERDSDLRWRLAAVHAYDARGWPLTVRVGLEGDDVLGVQIDDRRAAMPLSVSTFWTR